MGFNLIRLFDAFGKEVINTDKDKKRKARTPTGYLEQCSEMLCKCAYNMCQEFVKDKDKKIESKELKEACAAVKEAAAVISAIEKTEAPEAESIRIVFEENFDYTE